MHFLNKKSLLQAVGFIAIILVFGLIATIVMVVPMHRSAQASSPFGGMVTSVFYCSCSGNYRLDVSPPVGGTFMYEPGVTIVYEFQMIPVEGVWLLGLYGAPIACRVPSGKGCATDGEYPMIEMTGTSM